MSQELRPETLCVQAGWTPRKGEPRVLPIYQSTTFKYETSEQMAKLFDLEEAGFFYTRLQNPTNEAVARKIAELEGGVAAILTSSGQAASFFAVFNICEAGDHIVSTASIYGGTYNLFAVTFRKMGIEVTFVDQDAPAGNRQSLPSQYEGPLCGNHLQPHALRAGHPQNGGHRPCARRPPDRGQHLRHPHQLPPL